MVLISISAKPKIADYLWYKFEGKRKVMFPKANRTYDLEIDAGDRFGIKFGKKHFYLLHEDDPEILFKIKPDEGRRLISKSRGYKGKINKVNVESGLHGKDSPKMNSKPVAPVHSAPVKQSANPGEDKELTKLMQKVRFPGLSKMSYILTQRPVPGEVYHYYDVTDSLTAYRRKHRLKVTERGDFNDDLEQTVEKAVRGLDVEIGYVKHKGKLKQVLVVVELE
mgnify:CR=1 FL=1